MSASQTYLFHNDSPNCLQQIIDIYILSVPSIPEILQGRLAPQFPSLPGTSLARRNENLVHFYAYLSSRLFSKPVCCFFICILILASLLFDPSSYPIWVAPQLRLCIVIYPLQILDIISCFLLQSNRNAVKIGPSAAARPVSACNYSSLPYPIPISSNITSCNTLYAT